ncbi:MAG: Sua5/YciO/YrdC/YwlC family protein, partial [Alphaproteobacteria bacterium]|nr:Sua5/YciO/YrdC/YwlC family protein [Alphaproteobacteria bacterium]
MEGDRHSARSGSGHRDDPRPEGPLTGEATAADLADAVAALKAGRLALMPTETVYGLAADAGSAEAVAAIFAAKGRPRFNPLIAHVADLDAAQRVARLDARALTLAEAFWPGPLTLVAPARAEGGVCDLARAGLDTVAVRAPA